MLLPLWWWVALSPRTQLSTRSAHGSAAHCRGPSPSLLLPLYSRQAGMRLLAFTAAWLAAPGSCSASACWPTQPGHPQHKGQRASKGAAGQRAGDTACRCGRAALTASAITMRVPGLMHRLWHARLLV